MGWVTGIVVYVLCWWVVLFAILPLWVTPRAPDDVGHDTGAPQQPYMWRKVALTTVVAGVVWLGIYALVKSPYLSFRGG